MSDFQITIVGLGVTGISLGLALKEASKEISIVGHDRENAAASMARKAGAVDRTDWNLPGACEGAQIVILALPLSEIQKTLAVIGPVLREGCLVTDTAPMKAPVLAWAKDILPAHVNFVGGDPTGARGRAEAAADLFSGTTYCLCPASTTPPAAVEQASDLVQAVGATPRFLDAAEHDGLLAALDQLPFMLGAALLQVTGACPAWRELRQLGGGRFDQLLAALGDSPAAELEVAAANVANVGRWLEEVQAALGSLCELLAAEDPKVRAEAAEALLKARQEWERHEAEPGTPKPELKGFSLRKMFWFGQ